MKTSIYTVVGSTNDTRAELVEVSSPLLPVVTWRKLAEQIAHEKRLTPYPAAVLAHRWEQGQALIAVKDDQIVSYTSVVPVYTQAIRENLALALQLDYRRLPGVIIYEFTSGWTHPAWRHKGISLQLRRRLLQTFDGPDCLHIGITVGLGASPVLARLGWQIVAWSEIAFASSLLAMPSSSLSGNQEAVWFLPEGIALYEGSPVVPGQHSGHPWQNFCHFWVSKPTLIKAMHQELTNLLAGDLPRWRRAVLEAIRQSGRSNWKLIGFNERAEMAQSSAGVG